jgi:4-hydroxy-3-polyprenylbenzoate decarboxylase
LSEIRLENMHYLAPVGDVIFPPTVAYYARPTSVKEVTTHVVGRVIDQLGIEYSLTNRWKEDQRPVAVNGDRQLAEADDRTTRLDDKPCRPHGR